MRSWLAGLVFGVLALASLPVRGEEDPVRADDIVVEEKTLRPAEVFQDTPVETEILTEDDVRSLPARNAAQAVEKLPGIRTQQRLQGEESAVSIEGMPPEYTLILVDGHRYTGEIGAVSDLRDVPLENVERIEILRGSQGLRYGTEGAGGVINIVTKDPPDDGVRANADGGGGSDGAWQASATAAYGVPVAGGSVSFDHDQIDGFGTPEDLDAVVVGGGPDSRRLSRDANGTLRLDPTEGLTLRSRAGWRREDQDLELEDGGMAEREDVRWRAVQEMEWLATDTTRVLGDAGFYRNTTESEVGRSFTLEEDEWKLRLAGEQFLETWGAFHTVTLGADLRRQTLRLDEEPLAPGFDDPLLAGDRSPDESFDLAGLYLIAETELARSVSLEWGARVQLHSEFDTQVLPQVALLLRPLEALRIRLSWGRNSRTPSLRDLFQPPTPQLGGAYFLEGNPELTTETSTSYRAGLEFSPWSWLSVSAVGFYNDIEDHIRSNIAGTVLVPAEGEFGQSLLRPGLGLLCDATGDFFRECALLGRTPVQSGDPPGFVPSQLFRRTNLDSVRTRGLEARLELRPHRRVEVQLGYTLLDTEVVDSNLAGLEELPNSPRHTVDALLEVTAPWTETLLSARGRWRDEALVEGSGTGLLSFTTDQRSDPSFVLDARVAQPLGEHFEVYADLLNATDERQVDSLAVRGRTFFVGLRARFP